MARPRPEGLDAPWVRTAVVRFSQAVAWLYRRSGGKLGKLWLRGAPVCLLTTTGRRTRQPRTVPLVYARDQERTVVVACHGGLPHTPHWFRNLMSNPLAELQIGRVHQPVRARLVDGEERTRLWKVLVRVFPDFEDYESWTNRRLPVVILEPMNLQPERI